ncbi:hypothetical protein GDO86_007495 [Hymenochirus boettgeri]|uniref:CCAAT/enhancer-binding protein gamma n=1 Tax=Hymenochirus boettgeri TaxID=247094 RepID=A0A8T2J223_9PIPI|nr:hypothetical protein GDO86_007495 [Hymenochirus boettgeri]
MSQSPTVTSEGSSDALAGSQTPLQSVPLCPKGSKATPPSRNKKEHCMDHGSEQYRLRRERNNMAVKKSRLKSKQRAQDTMQRVNQLKEENERLESKMKLLSKELCVLKDLFLVHAQDDVKPEASTVGQDFN